MSIKFRCSECGHGIKAPDKAAGKGIKCPQCETKVRVPSGTRKKKVRKKQESSDDDSGEFLANLDIDRMGHAEVELCQKCATEIPEDETACPSCGFDPEHLTVAGRKRLKMTAKGIDPATFYESVWKDSFSFAFSHIGFIFKTAWIFCFSFLLAAMCVYFLVWVATVPPRSFWTLLTAISLLIPIGWMVVVHTEVIRLTINRKEKIKKIHFDFAFCGMSGLKILAWVIVFGIPFWVLFGGLGVLLDFSGISLGIPIGIGLALVAILCLVPQAMSHLSMPVEQQGWLVHKIVPTLGITLLPGLMWAMLFIVVNLPVLGTAATVYFVGGDKFEKFMVVRLEEGEIHHAKVILDFGEDVISEERKEELTEKYSAISEKEAPEKDWSSLVLPIFLGIVSCFLMAFSSLVVARANGLFTLNLKKALNLVGSLKELKYVKNETEEKIRTRRTTIAAPAGKRFVALLIDGGVISLIVGAISGITLYVMNALGVDFESQIVLYSLYGGIGLFALIVAGMYFTSAESGMEQATAGKKAMGLYVCDDDYRHISTAQAWGRFLAYSFLTPLTFGIGSLLPLFRPDKKTLHDILSGTQVRMDKPRKIRASSEDE